MANLYGSISYDHHARHIHRLAHRHISTSAQTWQGRVDVDLDKDGKAVVSVGTKSGFGMRTVWTGNVNELP